MSSEKSSPAVPCQKRMDRSACAPDSDWSGTAVLNPCCHDTPDGRRAHFWTALCCPFISLGQNLTLVNTRKGEFPKVTCLDMTFPATVISITLTVISVLILPVYVMVNGFAWGILWRMALGAIVWLVVLQTFVFTMGVLVARRFNKGHVSLCGGLGMVCKTCLFMPCFLMQQRNYAEMKLYEEKKIACTTLSV